MDSQGKVKFNAATIVEGHTSLKQLNFGCSEDLWSLIRKADYIGLNGSGLTLQAISNFNGNCVFSIHMGKNTETKTLLGKEDLSRGAEFTLTLPFKSQ